MKPATLLALIPTLRPCKNYPPMQEKLSPLARKIIPPCKKNYPPMQEKLQGGIDSEGKNDGRV